MNSGDREDDEHGDGDVADILTTMMMMMMMVMIGMGIGMRMIMNMMMNMNGVAVDDDGDGDGGGVDDLIMSLCPWLYCSCSGWVLVLCLPLCLWRSSYSWASPAVKRSRWEWKTSRAQEIKDLRKEFHQLSSSAARQDKKIGTVLSSFHAMDCSWL